MYASIRRYAAANPRLWEQLQQHQSSLEQAFRKVPGFQSWSLVRTGEGLTTVTLCDDQAGAEESARVAASWVRENLAGMISGQPEVSVGEVALQVSR